MFAYRVSCYSAPTTLMKKRFRSVPEVSRDGSYITFRYSPPQSKIKEIRWSLVTYVRSLFDLLPIRSSRAILTRLIHLAFSNVDCLNGHGVFRKGYEPHRFCCMDRTPNVTLPYLSICSLRDFTAFEVHIHGNYCRDRFGAVVCLLHADYPYWRDLLPNNGIAHAYVLICGDA